LIRLEAELGRVFRELRAALDPELVPNLERLELGAYTRELSFLTEDGCLSAEEEDRDEGE